MGTTRPTILNQIDRATTYHARQKRRYEREYARQGHDYQRAMIAHHEGALSALETIRHYAPSRTRTTYRA